jgi:hypothetical protein
MYCVSKLQLTCCLRVEGLLRHPLYGYVCVCLGPEKLSRYSYSLRDGRTGDRIPVGERFSVPVQSGSGAHPASYTMSTGFLCRG